jgi:hypothetical protein
MTATPPIVDRETWQKQIDTQRVREKAHTREGTRLPRLAGSSTPSRSRSQQFALGPVGGSAVVFEAWFGSSKKSHGRKCSLPSE